MYSENFRQNFIELDIFFYEIENIVGYYLVNYVISGNDFNEVHPLNI